MTKLSRNWSSNRRGKAVEALLRSSFSLLQFFFCIAALVLGFRLSQEALFVISSYKPSHDSFKGVRKAYTDTRFHSEVELGLPYVKDDRRNLTPSGPPRMPSSVEQKSSRVHVGRHEILIRSWPHPDPVHIALAHRLLSRIQEEQQRTFGLKERKQLLVITPTYVHTFQALYLTSLIYTLRAIPSPLIWIVVETGGMSSETAALLANSQLSYYHLGLDKACAVGGQHMQQAEILARLEGLRFIRNQELLGVVLFADESNTYSHDYFKEAQRIEWIGSFSVGVFSSQGSLGLSTEIDEPIENQLNLSRYISVDQDLNESNSVRASHTYFNNTVSTFLEGGSLPMPALPLQAPVCSSSGQLIGWYSSSLNGSVVDLEWTGFAMNARIFWKDYKRPAWIKDWTETFVNDQCVLESPLAFVRDASFIEPLGDCGKDVLMWRLHAEGRVGGNYPARWTISPPLDVVVPSKHTSWPAAHLASPPPPLLTAPPPPAFGKEQVSIRGKEAKGKGKRRSHHTKHTKTKNALSRVPEKSAVG